jgi:tRNA A-37 threonylcarbamoyl transferase component Bud32
MGDVYLAHHLLLGSRVALKVLAGERAGDQLAARRFVREARSAFRVDHPNCIRVTDLGAAEGRLYIAMEYLDGRTVAEELAVDGPIAAGRAAHIAAQIAEALAHAHGLGLVHRDLKPENVMLVTREADADYVKVLDFGLARIFDEHGDLAGTAISLSPLTKEGLVFGTPEYMSPEQASGGKVGPESDVYALGAVLYHMLTGAVPFGGATFTEILSRHVREPPVPPSLRRPDRDIPHTIDALVLECLAKSAAARPSGARVLADRLRTLAGEIGRTGSRLAPHLAASETMDLEASQIARAAATARHRPAPRERVSLTAEVPTTDLETVPARRSRRGVLLAAGALTAVAGGIALVTMAASSRGDKAETAPPIASAPRESGLATASAPAVPDAAPSPAAATDASVEPAALPLPTGTGKKKSESQLQAEKHVRAAEAARSAGNLLRQLSEADEARHLDPKNRRAAELMGEALVKSGDSARGCPLLRGSRLYRQVGCAD